jgi:hypothetical protein
VTDLTTLSVHREDWDWIKRTQLEMSATKGEMINLPDVVHALVETAKLAKEEALNG